MVVANLSQLRYLRLTVGECGIGEKTDTHVFSFAYQHAQQELADQTIAENDTMGLIDVQWAAAGWERTCYQSITYAMQVPREGVKDHDPEEDPGTLERRWSYRVDPMRCDPLTQYAINQYLQGKDGTCQICHAMCITQPYTAKRSAGARRNCGRRARGHSVGVRPGQFARGRASYRHR